MKMIWCSQYLNGTVHKQVEFRTKNCKWHGTKWGTFPSSGSSVLHESIFKKESSEVFRIGHQMFVWMEFV
jgi:hypothetical protein